MYVYFFKQCKSQKCLLLQIILLDKIDLVKIESDKLETIQMLHSYQKKDQSMKHISSKEWRKLSYAQAKKPVLATL